MSKVDAHWERVQEATALAHGTDTLVIGNGDVKSIAQARDLAAKTGVDGVMLARAIYGNPWLFDESRALESISPEERLTVMVEHAMLYDELFHGKKSFLLMRKHLRSYCSGFPGARDFRLRLELVNGVKDVVDAVEDFRRELAESSSQVQKVA